MRHVILAVVLAFLAAAPTARAADDLAAGRRAYLAGDYPVAVAILRPLAAYGRDPQEIGRAHV